MPSEASAPPDTGALNSCHDSLEEAVHQQLLAVAHDQPADLTDEILNQAIRRANPLLDADAVTTSTRRLRARISGTGGLDQLLADTQVTDVLINGPGPVWVERHGHLERSHVHLDRRGIDLLIEKSLGPLGLRADRSSPIVDARLADGSRLHVVLPPLAVDGPYVTIRRFAATTIPLSAFCAPAVAAVLHEALERGRNIIVSGGTGTGKTTLLNALCQLLPKGERVVTIEDSAELQLPGDHVVRLETRPATPDGVPARNMRDLLKAALRMRPDRVILGETRGREALDLIHALNTGHDGSLSTCHANSPVDALRRLESMALMAGDALPLPALREQLTSTVDLIVHLERGDNGRRRIAALGEVAANPTARRRVRTVAAGDDVVAETRRPPRRSARVRHQTRPSRQPGEPNAS